MSKLFTLCLLTLLALVTHAQPREQPLIVTTNTILANMTWNIVGDAAEVRSPVPLENDPQHYKPGEATKTLLDSADLILRNNLGLEPWLDEWIAKSNSRAKIITITAGISPLTENGRPNPYAWMNPRLGLVYLDNIKDALCDWSPADRQMFAFNHGVYRRQLLDVDAAIAEQLQQIPEAQRKLPPTHPGILYFANRYAIQVATDGTPFYDKLFIESLGNADGPVSTYLELLKYDAEIILANLKKRSSKKKGISHRLEMILGGIAFFLLTGGIIYVFRRLNR